MANRLDIPFEPVIVKVKEVSEQKKMQNSYQQAMNAMSAFSVIDVCHDGPVLLVDDIVDSRWTFTVCGELLRQKGAGDVYPLAIAASAEGGVD